MHMYMQTSGGPELISVIILDSLLPYSLRQDVSQTQTPLIKLALLPSMLWKPRLHLPRLELRSGCVPTLASGDVNSGSSHLHAKHQVLTVSPVLTPEIMKEDHGVRLDNLQKDFDCPVA